MILYSSSLLSNPNRSYSPSSSPPKASFEKGAPVLELPKKFSTGGLPITLTDKNGRNNLPPTDRNYWASKGYPNRSSPRVFLSLCKKKFGDSSLWRIFYCGLSGLLLGSGQLGNREIWIIREDHRLFTRPRREMVDLEITSGALLCGFCWFASSCGWNSLYCLPLAVFHFRHYSTLGRLVSAFHSITSSGARYGCWSGRRSCCTRPILNRKPLVVVVVFFYRVFTIKGFFPCEQWKPGFHGCDMYEPG